MRVKPHSDRDPKPPAHVWPYAWWGSSDVACTRCHRKVSEIDARALPCVSDEQIEKAKAASIAFARGRK